MSISIVAGFVLALAISMALSPFVSRRMTTGLVAVSWLALIGAFLAIEAEWLTTLEACLSASLFAGLAMSPTAISAKRLRTPGVVAAASVPGVLAVFLLAVRPDFGSIGASAQLPVVVALWAALVAALSASAGASAIPRHAQRRALPALGLLGASAAGAAVVVGLGRSSLPGAVYSIPLEGSGARDVFWRLPPVEGMQDGLRLAVVHAAPVVGILGVAVIVLGVIYVVAAMIVPKARWTPFVSLAMSAVAVGALVTSFTLAGDATLPEETAYSDVTRQTLVARKAEDRLAEQATFNVTEGVGADWERMAPEAIGFGLATLFGIIAFLAGMGGGRAGEESDVEPGRLFARDHAIRAVLMAWLAWFLGMLFHVGFYGAVGTTGPGEWVTLGMILAATGLVWAAWRPTGRFSRRLADVSPAAVGAVVLLGAGIAFTFGSPFGLSLTLF